MIEESFLMIGEQLRLRNIEIKKSLSPALPKIKGDANQLEQVFLNLITNARDAISENKDKPKNGTADSIEIITQPSETDENGVEIIFKDTGKGINEADQNNIFDPFFTTKEVGKGTGLGLSISYGLISDHNGQIEIAETGPQGTSFKITLPVAGSGKKDEALDAEKYKKTA
ncbi:sensor histidine kinase [Desulfosarcina sp.]|uniref:sensor histidine kinase n=1 Tax=Desulfosarcina sp. TaxID=2027861 RepID=UPI003562B163